MHSISELQKNILLYMSTQLSLLSLSDDSESDVPEVISAKKKEEKITAKYEDYSWYELVMSGKLNGLLVLELDKYLTKHNLNTNCSKIDKVREITADVLRKQSKGKQQGKIGSTSEKCKAVVHKLDNRVDSECSDNDSDSDDEDSDYDDLVLNDLDEKSHSKECDPQNEDLIVTTRSGRSAGSWRLAFTD